MKSKILGKIRLPIKLLDELQGNFKTLGKKQFEKLKGSIEKNGFIQPFFVWKDGHKNYILDGHQRKKAIIDLYGDLIDVDCLEIKADNIQEAKKFCIYYASSYADFDKETLLEFGGELAFSDLEDFNFPGVTFSEDDFLDDGSNDGEDEIPEVAQNECGVELGDIFTLGEHRLMCGDSTDLQTVEKLMDGHKADMVFTSPPYNAGSDELSGNTHTGKKGKYLNFNDKKSKDDYLSFISNYLNLWLNYADYTFTNLQMLSGNKLALIEWLFNFKEKFNDVLVWNKSNAAPAMAKNVFNSKHEYIYIHSIDNNSRAVNCLDFRGDQHNIFDLSSSKGKEFSDTHAATYPVEFPERFVILTKNKNAIVADPFGGSGSTLIACEKLKRKCYMMELDTHYCSVIIKRWEKFTGEKAVKCQRK